MSREGGCCYRNNEGKECEIAELANDRNLKCDVYVNVLMTVVVRDSNIGARVDVLGV